MWGESDWSRCRSCTRTASAVVRAPSAQPDVGSGARASLPAASVRVGELVEARRARATASTAAIDRLGDRRRRGEVATPTTFSTTISSPRRRHANSVRADDPSAYRRAGGRRRRRSARGCGPRRRPRRATASSRATRHATAPSWRRSRRLEVLAGQGAVVGDVAVANVAVDERADLEAPRPVLGGEPQLERGEVGIGHRHDASLAAGGCAARGRSAATATRVSVADRRSSATRCVRRASSHRERTTCRRPARNVSGSQFGRLTIDSSSRSRPSTCDTAGCNVPRRRCRGSGRRRRWRGPSRRGWRGSRCPA